MRSATNHAVIAVLATLSLSGQSMFARAEDQTTPPAPAPTSEAPAVAPLAPEPTTNQPGAADSEDKWKFTSPLLFWFPALKGTVEAKGQSADIDLSMSDIANHTDVGFVGYFDLSKGPFGAYVQPNYLKLSGDTTSGSTKADLSTQLWILETAAHYTFWEWGGNYHGSLAALGGLRFWQIHNELTIKDKVTSTKVHGGETETLYDPIVGLRYQQYFTPKLHVWVQGDVGGFDIGQDTSRFAWQVWPLLGYDFTMPVIKKPSTFFAGYRLLDSQNHQGSGADEQGYHLLFHGVTVGLNVELF